MTDVSYGGASTKAQVRCDQENQASKDAHGFVITSLGNGAFAIKKGDKYCSGSASTPAAEAETTNKQVAAESTIDPTIELLRHRFGEAAAMEVYAGLASTSDELTCASDEVSPTEQFLIARTPE